MRSLLTAAVLLALAAPGTTFAGSVDIVYTSSSSPDDEGSVTTVNATMEGSPPPLAYLFEWNDPCDPGATTSGEIESGQMAVGTHCYAANGVYHPEVWGVTGDGAKATYVYTINILNVPPTADAGPDRVGQVGETIEFVGAVADVGADDTSLQVEWYFGDGSPAAHSQEPWGPVTASHAYAAVGTYTVTVTAQDLSGAIGSDTATVMVVPEPGCAALLAFGALAALKRRRRK